jgi:drug/metabolite transporter (DMT)-like permease
MTFTAVLLLIASAFAHASWNWLGKKTSSSVAFYLVANAFGCLCLSPVLIFAGRALPQLLSSAWQLLLVAGLFQALYYIALSKAYQEGDLSIAYPIVRSASVLFVALASVALGRGRQLSPLAVAGIVVVAAGILVLPNERFRDMKRRNFLSRTALFALVAAVGTMGYSLADDGALTMLRPLLRPLSSSTEVTILYSFVEGLSTSLWILLFMALRRLTGKGRRTEGLRAVKGQMGAAFLTGFAMCFAYTLVLLAMGFARNVSYVVAFRQMSVPIGVALGVMALKEPLRAPKIIGVCAVTAGLVMVGLG